MPTIISSYSITYSLIKICKAFVFHRRSANLQIIITTYSEHTVIVKDDKSLNFRLLFFSTTNLIYHLSNLGCCSNIVRIAIHREIKFHVIGTIHFIVNEQNKRSILNIILRRHTILKLIVSSTCTRLRRKLDGKVDVTFTLTIPLRLTAIVNDVFT